MAKPSNLYRREGTWYGRVQSAGREHRRSLQTGDRAEAVRRLKAWRSELSAAVFGLERHSWQETVAQYVAEVLPGQVKPSTAKRYLCSLRQLDPILGGLWLDQIDRKVVARIAHRPGPTNATRRRDLTAATAVLRAAASWGWIERNPLRDFDRGVIRERRDPIRLPTDQEIDILIGACPPMLAALVRTLWLTGMRLEEAGSLERRQVDFAAGTVTLDKTKTGRPRVLPMAPAVHALLAGLPVWLDGPYVFWHGAGRRYANLSARLAAIGRSRGLGFRRHDLRHRYAVDFLQAGGSIYELQLLLGHSSIKTTEIYLDHLTPAQQHAAKGIARLAGTNPGTVAAGAGSRS